MSKPFGALVLLTVLALVLCSMMPAPASPRPTGGASSPLPDALGEAATAGPDDPRLWSGAGYRLATAEDVERLKERIGVRDPLRDYNEVVDGHGTGWAPPTEAEWDQMVGTFYVQDSGALKAAGGALPPAVDLSTSLYFPPVGDQDQQGSCVAWAATYYAYGYLMAKDKNWTDVHLGNQDHLMSPAWVYNKANLGYDSGTYYFANNMMINQYGAATLGTMPYDDGDHSSWGPSAAWREALSFDGIDYVTMNGPSLVQDMKEVLASGEALINFDMKAAQLQDRFNFGLGHDIILTSKEYNGTGGGHELTVVGYDDSVGQDNETGAFRVVNSWGTGWGEDGFFWLTYDCFEKLAPSSTVAYITDLTPRNTSLLATYHFSPAPGTDVDSVTFGIGGSGGTPQEVSVTFTFGNTACFPEFMCFDISELGQYQTGDDVFYLRFGMSSPSGAVSSFHIEGYEYGYWSGAPTQISDQSPDVPSSVDNVLEVRFEQYAPVTLAAAAGAGDLALSSGGIAQWVGHQDGATGGYEARSGDIASNQSTWLSTTVVGPGELAFLCTVDSEGSDYLEFSVDGTEMFRISGDVAWHQRSFDLDGGLHTLNWTYHKDGSADLGGDRAAVRELTWSGPLVILSEGFEDGSPYDWYTSDSDPDSGEDHWGLSDHRAHNGQQSAWCAQNGTSSVNGLPNSVNHYYDQNMNASMRAALPDLSGYDAVRINFWYWAVTGVLVESDYLLVETYNGTGWTTVWTQPGADSGGWKFVSVPIGTDATLFSFRFISDGTMGPGAQDGAYVDDVTVTGVDSSAPVSAAGPLPQYSAGAVVDVSFTAADQGGSGTAFTWLYYRMGTAGPFSLYRSSDGPDGGWGSSPIPFDTSLTGGDGVYQFYTVAVDNARNVEEKGEGPEASITVDTLTPTTEVQLSGPPGKNGWYAGEVTVTLTPLDAGGVDATYYQIDGGQWSLYEGPFAVAGEAVRTVIYYSVDRAGHSETPHSAVIKVDDRAPVVTMVMNGSLGLDGWYTSAVSVNLTASDGASGVAAISFRPDRGPWVPYTGNITVSAQGNHTMEYRAVDGAGNILYSEVTSFTIDSLPPETAADATGARWDTGEYTGPAILNLTAEDGRSGIGTIMFRVDEGNWSAYSLPITVSSAGPHVIEYYSVDGAGNREAVKELSFSIVLPLQLTVSPSATQGPAPLEVRFFCSVEGGQPSYTYLWDFGDGHTSADMSPVHQFTGIGPVTVSLTVTDAQGRQESSEVFLTIDQPLPDEPDGDQDAGDQDTVLPPDDSSPDDLNNDRPLPNDPEDGIDTGGEDTVLSPGDNSPDSSPDDWAAIVIAIAVVTAAALAGVMYLRRRK